MKKFKLLVDLAFDPDVNKAFDASIALARAEGVKQEKILKTKAEIDNYFLS